MRIFCVHERVEGKSEDQDRRHSGNENRASADSIRKPSAKRIAKKAHEASYQIRAEEDSRIELQNRMRSGAVTDQLRSDQIKGSIEYEEGASREQHGSPIVAHNGQNWRSDDRRLSFHAFECRRFRNA